MIGSNWKHKKEQQRKYHKLLLITNNSKGERINWTKMKNWREEREKKKNYMNSQKCTLGLVNVYKQHRICLMKI